MDVVVDCLENSLLHSVDIFVSEAVIRNTVDGQYGNAIFL